MTMVTLKLIEAVRGLRVAAAWHEAMLAAREASAGAGLPRPAVDLPADAQIQALPDEHGPGRPLEQSAAGGALP
jgi:hypothetical protein